MEVHHHPHVEGKRFKDYFLEFIMIFLAVSLGFFAENIREHISDKEKAKDFAGLLYQDFQANAHSLTEAISFTNEKIKSIDSLTYMLNIKREQVADSNLYRYAVYLISTSPFDNISGGYEQIKSTGSLGLFNHGLINNLNSYDATVLKLKLMEDWENKVLYEQTIQKTGTMFNFNVFDDLRSSSPVNHEIYFREAGKESIDILVNQSIVIKHLRERQLVQQKSLLDKADVILTELQKDYHLK